MKHLYWIIPDLLAARPGPDEAAWNLDELRAGFGAILSLHAGGVDVGEIERRGFMHKLLVLPDSVPPAEPDVATYRQLLPQALAFVKQHVDRRIPTLVHCHAGKDRTGVVLTCYLSVCIGVNPAEAIARLQVIRPGCLSAPGYEELACRLLTGEARITL